MYKTRPNPATLKLNSEIRKEDQLLIQQKVYEGEEFIDRPTVTRDTALDKSGYSLPQYTANSRQVKPANQPAAPKFSGPTDP